MVLQKAPPARIAVRSVGSTEENSSSGLPRSAAVSSSGYDDEQAAATQPAVDKGRSAVPRDAAERRRKRTSKSLDVDKDTRRSTSRSEAAGDSVVEVSDIRPDIDSTKLRDPVVNKKAERSEEHTLNGHVEAPAAVTKDATAALATGSRRSAEYRRKVDADVVPVSISDQKTVTAFTATGGGDSDHAVNGHKEAPAAVAKDATVSIPGGPRTSGDYRRKEDADVVPLKTSDHKTTSASAVAGGRDSAHVVNGHKEAPVPVAKDATVSLPGGPRTSAEDRRRVHETETDATVKDDNQQVSSLPSSVEHQTDIKHVNPDMAIFDVLHRQQANKTQGDSEGNNVQPAISPERSSEPQPAIDVETPTTVYSIFTALAHYIFTLM